LLNLFIAGYYPHILIPRPFINACVIITTTLIVKYYTIQHPFLLADNRHYTFYIWRYVFRISPWIRYAIIPIYVFSMHVLFSELSTAPALWSIFYIGCVACTLIPSPLIEFRYYIIRMFLTFLIRAAYYFYRIHLSNNSSFACKSTSLRHELALFILINAFTMYMFLYRPFEWPSEPGIHQRFIW
jgi:alpha-1,2-glucosyltransferase